MADMTLPGLMRDAADHPSAHDVAVILRRGATEIEALRSERPERRALTMKDLLASESWAAYSLACQNGYTGLFKDWQLDFLNTRLGVSQKEEETNVR